MNALERSKMVEVEGQTYELHKFTALEGYKLGMRLFGQILPILKTGILGAMEQEDEKKNLVELAKDKASEVTVDILNKIDMSAISDVLVEFSKEDLDYLTKEVFTHISKPLPAQSCFLMDSKGNWQVEGIEYDPVLFLALILEELKFGLADFFNGNRWSSLLGGNTAESPLQAPLT